MSMIFLSTFQIIEVKCIFGGRGVQRKTRIQFPSNLAYCDSRSYSGVDNKLAYSCIALELYKAQYSAQYLTDCTHS